MAKKYVLTDKGFELQEVQEEVKQPKTTKVNVNENKSNQNELQDRFNALIDNNKKTTKSNYFDDVQNKQTKIKNTSTSDYILNGNTTTINTSSSNESVIDLLKKVNPIDTKKYKEIASDGFQLKDIWEYTKLTGKTAGKAVESVGKGILSVGEGIGDFAVYRAADILEGLGVDKNYLNQVRSAAKEDLFGKVADNTTSKILNGSALNQTGEAIFQGVGSSVAYGALGGTLSKTADKAVSAMGLKGTAAKATNFVIKNSAMFASAMGSGESGARNQMDYLLQDLSNQLQYAPDEETRQYIQNKINDITTNYEKYSKIYALVTGTAETLSENIFDGLERITGYGSSELNRMLTKGISNAYAANIIGGIISGVEEGSEEVFSNFGTAIAEKLTYMSDEELKTLFSNQDNLESFLVGFMSTAISQAPNTMIASKKGVNISTGRTFDEENVIKKATELVINERTEEKGSDLTTKEKNEIKQDIEERFEKGTLDEDMILSLTEYNDNNKQTKELNTKIEELSKQIEELKSKEANANTMQKADLILKRNELVQQQEELRQQYNELTKANKELKNNEINNILNSNNEYLKKSIYNLTQKNESYNNEGRELIEGKNAKRVYDSLNKLEGNKANNTTQMHEIADNVAKFSENNNVKIQFENNNSLVDIQENDKKGRKYVELDNSTKEKEEQNNRIEKQIKQLEIQMENATSDEVQELAKKIVELKHQMIYKTLANGFVDDKGVIHLNIESTDLWNVVLGHEFTHLLEKSTNYKDYQKLLFKVAKNTKTETGNLYTDIANLYDGKYTEEEMSSELTAQLTGKLLTDEKFIKEISNKPTLIENILNVIKELKTLLIGTEQEKQMLKLEKMYKDMLKEAKAPSKTKLSIIGEEAVNNFKNSKYSQIQDIGNDLDNLLEEAKELKSKGMSNKELIKINGWYLDKNNKWKYEMEDSSMSLKEDLEDIVVGKEYSANELFKHNFLTKAYPELENYKFIFEYLGEKTNGKHNEEEKIITINSRMLDYNKFINEKGRTADANRLNLNSYEYAKANIEGTLLHEIQHFIQSEEGFERGRNSSLFKKAYYESLGEIEADNTKERYIEELLNKNYRLEHLPESSKENPKHRQYQRYMSNRKEINKILDDLYDKYGDKIDKNMDKIYNFLKKRGLTNEEANYVFEKYEEKVLQENNNEILLGRLNESNTRFSYATEDNKGRTLTKEQQEYFKDSVVKNNKGELISVYHGSPEEFNIFDIEKAGTNGVAFGNGFYFTNKKTSAEGYAKGEGRTLDGYLDIKKPASSEDITIEFSDLQKLYDALNTPENYDEEMGMTYIDVLLSDYDENPKTSLQTFYRLNSESDVSLIDALSNIANPTQFYKTLRDTLGYDGIVVEQPIYGNTEESYYIAFNSDQFKNADNKTPTRDSDIRFSKSTDNNGRNLTIQQEEYFKNSKVRDENGNLLTIYHGSPDADFTVFKPGSYFSSNYEYAKGYENTWASSLSNSGKKGNKPNTYEVYLNITNPFTLKNETAKNIYLKEYIKGGNSAYFDPYTDYTDTINSLDEIDWVEGEDLKEWLQENHPEYDGLYLDEGGDGGYGNAEYRWRGISIVPFNSNQIKNIDNLNPTENEDIRYSKVVDEKLPYRKPELTTKENEYIPFNYKEELENDIKAYNEEVRIKENAIDWGLSDEQQQAFETLENESEQYEKELDEYYKSLEAPEENPFTDDYEENEFYKADYNPLIMYLKNTEVREQLKGLAEGLLSDFNQTIKGERGIIDTNKKGVGSSTLEFYGWGRQASDAVNELMNIVDKNGNPTYTYDDIENALRRIINEDIYNKNGELSNKKLTDAMLDVMYVLDEMGTNGYNTIEGYEIPINQNYIASVKQALAGNEEIEINPYEEQEILPIPNETRKKVTNEEDYLSPIKIEDYSALDVEEIEETIDNIFNELIESDLPRDAALEYVSSIVKKYDTEYKKAQKNKPSNNNTNKMLLDLKEKFVNSNEYIDKLAKRTGNQEIKFKGDMWNSASTTAQYNNEVAQTDLEGNKIGKSITQIFDQARNKNLYEAFTDYLFQKSNIERHSKGKGSIVPEAVSLELVNSYDRKYPIFEKWQQDVVKYYDNLLDLEVKSGLIDESTYNFFRGQEGIYKDYVPFFSDEIDETRYFNNKGELKPFNQIKKSKGYASEIAPIEQSMKKQSFAVWNSIRTNELYNEIINSLGGDKASIGIDERTNPTDLVSSLYEDAETGAKYLTSYQNGEQVSVRINDYLYNELNRTNENKLKQLEETYSMVTKPLQKVSEIRRNILTSWNPVFALYKNPVKDIQDALFYSKHTTDMIKNYPSAFKELYSKDTKLVNQFLALYGTENKKGIGKLGEVIELAPRYAEFKASLENGASLSEALYNAKDVTTNFGRGGYVTKAMNRNGFTFLNASVQGFDKIIRNFKEQPNAKGIAMVLGKAALLGIAPSVFNALCFGLGDDKDEDYEALSTYLKDNYYLIKISDEYNDKLIGGHFVRIPKGRVLSVMGSAARRSLETIDTGENQFKGYLDNAWSQIAPVETGNNLLDQTILAPIAQVMSGDNGTAWYGGDIVPTRLQDKPKAEQTDASIDAFSNWLGEKLNISPYKVNYVIDQYSGGFGDILLPMITEETTSGAETPLDYLEAFLKDQFIVDSTNDNKYAGEFYDKLNELKIINNGSNVSDEDKLKYSYMSGVSSELGKLYSEKREIQSNSSLSNSEKYEKVQEIQKEINTLAKEGMDTYNNISKNGNFANINGKDYYQNEEGKWKKTSESDEEDTLSLGMTTKEKEKYYSAKATITSINSDYTKQKKNASDSEKEILNAEQKSEIVDVISTSGLTNEQKYALYDNYYGSEKTSEKMLNANIDFNSYAIATMNVARIKDEYKNTDGMTSKQKTAQGKIRKSQVQQYLNSLDIDMEQKMMLEHYLGGYSIKNYKNYLQNYINNLDITQQEKAELWDSLFK